MDDDSSSNWSDVIDNLVQAGGQLGTAAILSGSKTPVTLPSPYGYASSGQAAIYQAKQPSNWLLFAVFALVGIFAYSMIK